MTVEPNDTITSGVHVTLTCRIDNAVPHIEVKWYHNDVPVFAYRATAKEVKDRYRKDNPTPTTWRYG